MICKLIDMNMHEPIVVMAMIKREMKNKKIRPADLARGLRISPSSVQGMLKRPKLQVHRLLELCEVFQYNFFTEIALQLPYEEPKAEENTILLEKEKRISELEMEVSILRKTLKELVTR